LDEYARIYLEAFWLLSISRPVSGFGGTCPIPLSEIKAYLDLFQVERQEDREAYVLVLKRIDLEYIKIMNEKEDAKSKKGSIGGAGRSSNRGRAGQNRRRS